MSDYKYQYGEEYELEISEIFQEGYILDIGGGGEGIIGKKYGKRVVSIDIRKDELEEVKNEALKIVMDATDLGFIDESFVAVTSFYALMYMTEDEKAKAMQEAFRVLKTGGRFIIWDTDLPSNHDTDAQVYVTPLRIFLDEGKEPITTGYGVGIGPSGQKANQIEQMLISIGFQNVICIKSREHFKILGQK